MDSLEGSANDAMTAEINRRVNEAVNVSIRPLQDQITQLLIALNVTSDGITIAVEGRKKPLPNPLKFTGRRKDYAAWSQQIRDKIELDVRYISSNTDI
ncbi:pol-like protein [Colletotrichum kahawae]|uniref:Pol-like protein n=1 Tax=Colletotrichum kahawae TaxID=34407 RepID=A0AAE0DCJ8_COLKA|nr:pol-like protein [Colletotrichum kahawae]